MTFKKIVSKILLIILMVIAPISAMEPWQEIGRQEIQIYLILVECTKFLKFEHFPKDIVGIIVYDCCALQNFFNTLDKHGTDTLLEAIHCLHSKCGQNVLAKIVKIWLDRNDISLLSIKNNPTDSTILHQACTATINFDENKKEFYNINPCLTCLESVLKIASNDKKNPTALYTMLIAKDWYGYTPMFYALLYENKSVINLLEIEAIFGHAYDDLLCIAEHEEPYRFKIDPKIEPSIKIKKKKKKKIKDRCAIQ